MAFLTSRNTRSILIASEKTLAMTSGEAPYNDKLIPFGWPYTFEPVQKQKCQTFPTRK
ncbi:hypothetical protein KsCSTR_28070 [Candidatus Kuenenia stuttgartiensis]|uniref:Uncharacterized protein n=1 Tax=Kuenenia stuttgartiensis TaxID=174633 RepID=A0A6G7GRK2_KUEST|nr:hypothetical protein KsCSTR_28070 [Candidatus Kuenenia stuttgartiensis]